MTKAPVRVAVTGAAGQIGYAILFRIASGQMLGADQPVNLQLLEIADEKAQKALRGVMMELEDCAFPLLAGMSAHSDPLAAFKDAEVALLVGARPRGPGMERKDLLATMPTERAPWDKVLHMYEIGRAPENEAHPDHELARDLERGFWASLPFLDDGVLGEILRRGRKLNGTGESGVEAGGEALRASLGLIASAYDGGFLDE